MLLGMSFISWSQRKLDVTIIGTAHYFKDEYKPLQDFGSVQDFIVELNPDIICIEAIPTYDTSSLKEIWPRTMKRADALADTLDSLDSYSQKIIKGGEAYSRYDLWNAYYYWFQVEQQNDTLGYFSKYQKKLSNSEYGLIVFPAAQKLGIDRFSGIDYRDGEDEFLANNQKVFKKLFFKLKWKPLKTYLRTQKKYKKAEKEGKLIEFINGDEFQKSFSQLIEEIPERLPKSEEARNIKQYWLNRNQIMANRIIKQRQ